jgi:hypothetical protein
VPLHDVLVLPEERQERVLLRIRQRPDRLEPDLLGPLHDLDVERAGEQLRPQTDPEVGDAAVHGLPRVGADRREVRVLLGLVDVDRAAERDDPGDVLERRQLCAGRQMSRDDVGAGPRKRGERYPERLIRVVADEQDGSHGRECTEGGWVNRARSTAPAPSPSPCCCRR